jgi:hypothetical protein
MQIVHLAEILQQVKKFPVAPGVPRIFLISGCEELITIMSCGFQMSV